MLIQPIVSMQVAEANTFNNAVVMKYSSFTVAPLAFAMLAVYVLSMWPILLQCGRRRIAVITDCCCNSRRQSPNMNMIRGTRTEWLHHQSLHMRNALWNLMVVCVFCHYVLQARSRGWASLISMLHLPEHLAFGFEVDWSLSFGIQSVQLFAFFLGTTDFLGFIFKQVHQVWMSMGRLVEPVQRCIFASYDEEAAMMNKLKAEWIAGVVERSLIGCFLPSWDSESLMPTREAESATADYDQYWPSKRSSPGRTRPSTPPASSPRVRPASPIYSV